MTTYEQRELAGVSPIIQPIIPTESKHDSDETYKKDHELALDNKKIRLLDNPMIEYKQGEITETLGNPRDKIMEQLKSGKYRNITKEEALHIPYRYAA